MQWRSLGCGLLAVVLLTPDVQAATCERLLARRVPNATMMLAHSAAVPASAGGEVPRHGEHRRASNFA